MGRTLLHQANPCGVKLYNVIEVVFDEVPLAASTPSIQIILRNS